MKIFMIFMIMFATLFANSNTTKNHKKAIVEKHIKEQLAKEKKYSKEQTFYNEENYDFSGAEVNPESVKTTPELEVDDLDMDSVYD